MDFHSILQRASVNIKNSGIVLSEDQSAAAVTVDSEEWSERPKWVELG